ncbi:hypothetical protein OS493_016808 [Desmophyllum pertusum]|uniref:Uncharacterized protein n=1 Tax=Desmophyllum pertusum TaxID=174260 RepID=A0A9X0CRL2_9CNID|nr:hypothetical protein OS493_016808 [Desmophyllum pertusum]
MASNHLAEAGDIKALTLVGDFQLEIPSDDIRVKRMSQQHDNEKRRYLKLVQIIENRTLGMTSKKEAVMIERKAEGLRLIKLTHIIDMGNGSPYINVAQCYQTFSRQQKQSVVRYGYKTGRLATGVIMEERGSGALMHGVTM